MNSAAEPGERVLLAAGTQNYQHGADFDPPLENLNRVGDALRSVVQTLTGLGYQSTPEGARKYLLNPSLRRLKKAVRAASESAPVVVVYYTGHGIKPDRSPYYLVTTGARPDLLEDTALEARRLLELVLRKDARGNVLPRDEQPQVLLILDCCFSGAAGVEALKESLQGIGNHKVWMLASASSIEYAEQGLFADALKRVLLHPEVGTSQRLLGGEWLAGIINSALSDTEQRARYILPGGESTELPPFFPNPTYVPDVSGLTVAEQRYWVSRLRGAPAGDTDTGFYVTGRIGRMRVVEDLAGWMRDPDRGGLAVVTGSPGTGKSAMLALPVLLTDVQRRDTLVAAAEQNSLITRAADLFADLPVLGIRARGKNPYEVADAVADYLGRSADSPEELLAELDDHPETSPRIVVIDAVDEARDPRGLLTGLLLPLARRPRLRVVAGTRHHLLRLAADTTLMIDLDKGHYSDPQALADYACQLLVGAHEPDVPSPYRDHADVAVTVATAIASKATARPTATGQAESFLLAQMLARAVRGRQNVLDVTRAGWPKQLPADVGAAFDDDLRRLGRREPTARALLAALAWANGPGLPWENIWVPVARALAERVGTANPPSITNDDIRWLLDKAGAYVAEDVGPGQRSVFRPFHDLLAMHLRGEPSSEQIHARARHKRNWDLHRHQAEKAITQALITTVPVDVQGRRDWVSTHPYLRTYLAQHAAAAGPETLAELAQDMDFLAVADPVTLSPLLSPTIPEVRQTARVYRRAHPLLGDDPSANTAYLAEAERALTGTVELARSSGIHPLYRTRLASARKDDSLIAITAHTSRVLSVAFGTTADGQLLLASSDKDGTVRLWDPVTGTPAAEPLTGHADSVDWVGYRWTPEVRPLLASDARSANSVAFGTTADGRLLLASGGGDGTVRLWDPVTGTPVGEPLTGHASSVFSVAFGTTADRQLLLATSSHDGTTRLWDPAIGTPVGEPLSLDTGWVNSVAFGTTADGQLLLATGGRTIQLWDPAIGTPVGEPLSLDTGWVNSVAFGTTADGQLLLATCSGVTVQLWDPVTRTPAGEPLTGHADSVHSVAFGTTADGRLLLATGSNDKTVRLWDPVTGTPVGQPLTGHASWVESVAFGTTADGQLLLATGSWDGTVRLWDPATIAPAGELLTSGGYWSHSVAFGTTADGQVLLASASNDKTVRLWDPVAGIWAGEPLIANVRWVESVAFGTTADGQLLLATCGMDGPVQLWDPLTGTPAGEPLTGADSVSSVAFGTTADRQLLLATCSGVTVQLWDPVTGAPVGEPLTVRWGGVDSVAFGTTADGRLLLATGSKLGTVHLWDPLTGAPAGGPLNCAPAVGVLTGRGDDGVSSVAFGTTADGRLLLATGSDHETVWVWDALTGAPAGEPLTGHSVAFGTSADGRLLLATGGEDKTVRLWDTANNACVLTLRRRSPTTSIALSASLLAIGDREAVSVIEPWD